MNFVNYDQNQTECQCEKNSWTSSYSSSSGVGSSKKASNVPESEEGMTSMKKLKEKLED